jgi:hypothetical protein
MKSTEHGIRTRELCAFLFPFSCDFIIFRDLIILPNFIIFPDLIIPRFHISLIRNLPPDMVYRDNAIFIAGELFDHLVFVALYLISPFPAFGTCSSQDRTEEDLAPHPWRKPGRRGVRHIQVAVVADVVLRMISNRLTAGSLSLLENRMKSRPPAVRITPNVGSGLLYLHFL